MQSITTLLDQASRLNRATVGQLADVLRMSAPSDLKKEKGWVGRAVECYLGVDNPSAKGPDFPQYGCELKTIPVNAQGRPNESTFVCVINLTDTVGQCFSQSLVWQKLQQVLWVPYIASKEIAVADWQFLKPRLWRPTPQQQAVLQRDWEQHMDNIALGRLSEISASDGDYLQIRPKAANAKALCQAYNEQGELVPTLPRGFYLRASATAEFIRD